jgi:hypothetical protein
LDKIDEESKREKRLEDDGKIQIRKGGYMRSYEPTPEIEWWDAAFLPPTQ